VSITYCHDIPLWFILLSFSFKLLVIKFNCHFPVRFKMAFFLYQWIDIFVALLLSAQCLNLFLW
jgi:hypothetical protein